MPYSSNSIRLLIDNGSIQIQPFDERGLKKTSYTLHTETEIHLEPQEWRVIETMERVTIDSSICGILFTRGSIAQMGVDALLTDCFIEPEFSGKLKLSVVNHSKKQVTIPAGSNIVKIVFFPSQEL